MEETPEAYNRRLTFEQTAIEVITKKVVAYGGAVFLNDDEAADLGFRLVGVTMPANQVGEILGRLMERDHGAGNWGVSLARREDGRLNTEVVSLWSVPKGSELEQIPKRVTASGAILALVQKLDEDTDIDNK